MHSLDELLRGAGIPLEAKAAQQMQVFLALLVKWNVRVNLTASTEWKAIGPFFEEAIWAARLYPGNAVTHLDIGSGAGFPALPLRILRPQMQLELVESRAKRSVFLEGAIQELGLENVQIINDRLDRFLASREGSWDFVSWKALKLGRDLADLAGRATDGTRFWMFHGKKPAVENVWILEELLTLERRDACPAHKDWWLSVYRRAARRECFT